MKKSQQKFSFCKLKTFTEKIFLTFLLLFSAQQVFAQVSENFSDGDFRVNPEWSGNDSDFSVANEMLQLTAPAVSGASYLSTASLAINHATWEFSVKLQFNPSSTNYSRIYVVSDAHDLSGTLNGYFIQLGGTTDEVSLYRQTGTIATKIIDGEDGLLNISETNIRFKLTRDAGSWNLFHDLNQTGTYQSAGSVVDQDHVQSFFAGVYCKFTATRSDKFYFDDIVITGDPYVAPPEPAIQDVIITEIFPDPSPSQKLPESEFIEVYNRSANTFNLKDWSISDGSTTTLLPSEEISSGEFIIITSSSAVNEWKPHGKTIGVSGFPSLNNDGDYVILKKNDLTIDSIRFDTQWYHDKIKQDGGWSIEIIDPKNLCGEINNWIASEDPSGGTPGKINSVNADKPDLTPPLISGIVPLSVTSLTITFNERLDKDLPPIEAFDITPRTIIQGVSFADHSLRKLNLSLANEMAIHTSYKIEITNVADCNGNVIDKQFLSFALPEPADSMDVVINEILFNPRPTGVDFIEIVNASDKYLNLKNWSLANHTDVGFSNIKIISNDDLLISPAQYVLLTEDENVVAGEYIQSEKRNFFTAELPSLNDDEGSIVLINDDGKILDEFHYSKNMHSIFLKDEEGVSLERIGLHAKTQDEQNWKSAASVSGFATPGLINSASRAEDMLLSETISVEPEIFRPIAGTPDFTKISYRFDQGGLIANVKIFDSQGRQIREIANNELLATEGFFRWDGDRDDGLKARVGAYMISFEVYSSTGTVNTYRKRIAIGF